MYLTLLLADFFNADWSAQSYELRSHDQPFRIQTGRYRPLHVDAAGKEIGTEVIFGYGQSWIFRSNGPYDPADRWIVYEPERVTFEIRYAGVTPPLTGIGGYNLVLPPGWRFSRVTAENPNSSGASYGEANYAISRDDEADREALRLFYEGANSRFSLVVQALVGDLPPQHDLGVISRSRIVEPDQAMSEPDGDGSVAENASEPSAPSRVLAGEVPLVYLPRESGLGEGTWPNKALKLAICRWAIGGGPSQVCFLRASLLRRGLKEPYEGELNSCEEQRTAGRVEARFKVLGARNMRSKVTLWDDLGRAYTSKVDFPSLGE